MEESLAWIEALRTVYQYPPEGNVRLKKPAAWLQAFASTSTAVAFLVWVRRRPTTTPLSGHAARTAALDILEPATPTTVSGSQHA